MNPIKHVAIIMDGNGRWGLKYKKSRNLGHNEGLKTIEKIIKASIKNKIKYLTLYAFSTVFSPSLWPRFLDFLCLIPQRPLPSMIMATCLTEFIFSLFLFL